jgi:hypothetical protein
MLTVSSPALAATRIVATPINADLASCIALVTRLHLRPVLRDILWKLRMFAPSGATCQAILAKILERYPLERIFENAEA